MSLVWKHKRGTFDLAHRGLIMGILNVTPDSFSDGGRYFSPESAVEHALEMVAGGADIIDVGGESTRPGAESVGEAEERRRVLPVIRSLRKQSDVPISIDTFKASVAREAVEAGADIINDVTALRGDPAMPTVARDSGAGVVLMHMQGEPRTMQAAPHYSDVVREVGEFLIRRQEEIQALGVPAEFLAIDPGIGFGKTPAHNLALIRATETFARLGRPVLIGVSRKSFLAWLADAPRLEDRLWPAVALTSFCREQGARIFRVHDPKPHREALRMTEAILGEAAAPAVCK